MYQQTAGQVPVDDQLSPRQGGAASLCQRLGLRLTKPVSTVILSAMRRPRNEREAWEHELREELPAQLVAYQQELVAGHADKTRREFLERHVRRVRMRMDDLEARLTKIDASRWLTSQLCGS